MNAALDAAPKRPSQAFMLFTELKSPSLLVMSHTNPPFNAQAVRNTLLDITNEIKGRGGHWQSVRSPWMSHQRNR
jgi:hypothetical protein